MKISELISILEKAKEENGDIDVGVQYREGDFDLGGIGENINMYCYVDETSDCPVYPAKYKKIFVL